MNRCVSSICLLLGILVSIPASRAQTVLVGRDYFPAELEFKELGAFGHERLVTTVESLDDASERSLFAEAGFRKLTSRAYSLSAGGTLSIEIFTLNESRAAFSLLTTLRTSPMQEGPPGNAYAVTDSSLLFSRGNILVRLKGQAPADLMRRVAVSISNRIGGETGSAPLLISHFPKEGYDPSSLRYCLGPKSLGYVLGKDTAVPPFPPGVELALAHFSLPPENGMFWLGNFPTSQMAEDYMDTVAADRSPEMREKRPIYAKRTGPLLGLLTGNFDAATANRLLGSLKFSYSIKWIYDKNQSGTRMLWGVPMGVLGTVLRSLVFTALLCLASIVGGISIAVFRLVLRRYAPRNYLDRPERTEMIRLNLHEN